MMSSRICLRGQCIALRIFRRTLVLLLVLSGLFITPFSAVAEGPIIESIQGAPQIILKTDHRGDVIGKPNMPLLGGDQISTGVGVSVVLKYPDGSRILIGESTQFEQMVEQPGISQRVYLNQGKIRGLVRKVLIPGKKPRLVIRSKGAVMGVRGTDFVVEAEKNLGTTSLHTLEGEVALARTVDEVISEKAVYVKQGEWLQASKSEGVGQVKRFDVQHYQKQNLQELEGWSSPKRTDSLFRFRAQGAYIRQKSGGYLMTSSMSWNPAITLLEDLQFSLGAAVIPMKGGRPLHTAMGTSLSVSVEYRLLGLLWTEVGVGWQRWGDLVRPGAEYRASLRLSQFNAWILDGLIGTVSYFDRPSQPYNPAVFLMFGAQFVW